MRESKYKYRCREFCLKCEKTLSFYKPNEKGRLYPVICKECGEKIRDIVERLEKPHYWTKEGYI